MTVDLADQDSLPHLTDGTWALSVTGCDRTTHAFTLRIPSCFGNLPDEEGGLHLQHCSDLDLATQRDTSGTLCFGRSLHSHTCSNDVLVSFTDTVGIIAFCLIQSVSKSHQTRAAPTWTVTLVHTQSGYRGKGFASALLMCATQRAVQILPQPVTARTSPHLDAILAGAGFERNGHCWVYNHHPLTPGCLRYEMSRLPPIGFGSPDRLCAINCAFQLVCGQPGMATWIDSCTWPILRCGHSIAMLLGFNRTTGSFHQYQASTTVLLGCLYTNLVRRNKCIQGGSTSYREDQDALELFLELLHSLDRELPPGERSNRCRLKVYTSMTCANPDCLGRVEVVSDDRIIRLVVPTMRPGQPPLRLEAILNDHTEGRRVEHRCEKCCGDSHIHQTRFRNLSADVFVGLDRNHHQPSGDVIAAPVLIPTLLSLEDEDQPRVFQLRSVLIHTWVRGTKRDEMTPHWIVVTCRVIQDKLRWFLVNDEAVDELGDIGDHQANITLTLNHERLRDFQNATVCGAFYARIDPTVLPLPQAIRPTHDFTTPLLSRALHELSRSGAQVTQCHTMTYSSPQSLRQGVTSTLSLNSPAGLRKVPYLRGPLTEVYLLIRRTPIRLSLSGGSLSRPALPVSFLSPRAGVKGNAEALEGGLQSSALQGHGRALAEALGDQLGTTLLDPAGVVITTANYVTPFHFHAIPVVNMFISTFEARSWRTAGLFDSSLSKSYLFTSADTLESVGIKPRGSIDLPGMLSLISRLPKQHREVIRFEYLVMDGRDVTHVVFPARWYHWVATESMSLSKFPCSLYCGVGSYMFPNDLLEAHKLQQSLVDHASCTHTARQRPTPAESAALLARHITSLDSPPAAQDQMVTDRQNDASNPTVSHA